jgi:tetratricopeptide (TPR) repeat protein
VIFGGSASRAYSDALELGAPDAQTRLGLAALHAELGEPAAAAEHLEAILSGDPGSVEARCRLAQAKYELGRYAESAALCRQALEEHPGLHQANYRLGLVHLEAGNHRDAAASFARCFEAVRGAPQFPAEDMTVNRVKLAHDREQFEHLVARGRLPAEFSAVIAQYRELLGMLPAGEDGHLLFPVDAERFPLLARTYKRPLHVDAGAAPEEPLLDPATDWPAAEERYLAAEPSVTVVDGLLTPAALDALRRFCMDSTVWNDVRAGYLGAYLDQGLAPEALLRIASELRERLPRVMRGLPLQSLWAYKYDSEPPGMGIGLHADSAAVNVNFWITPDDANLDPDHGGLLVYLRKAPPDWSFEKYNRDWQSIVDFVEQADQPPLCVPYRCNRAVIFDSDLFHATDAPRFRAGYANRRINITLLYGHRGA